MKPKRIFAVYFSPTGTTKKTVETIADALATKLSCAKTSIDFTTPEARAKEYRFDTQDLVIFGSPVYAGRVPNLIAPSMKSQFKGNGALAVPVVDFGNRNYDDALIELRDILEADGFLTVAAAAFVAEHSFSRILGAHRPDAEDLKKMKAFAKCVAEKVGALSDEDLLSEHHTPVAVDGNEPIGPYFTPRDRHGKAIDIRKVKPKTSDACIFCLVCVESCPMGAIEKTDPRNIPGICIKCCACEKKCPVGAKYFDDPNYLYHKKELEEVYTRRAEPSTFL